MSKENTNSSGKLTEKMTRPEFETMKEKVQMLPLNRQVFVFLGITLVITALLGSFGNILAAIIGMTMFFSGMLKLRLFERCLEKCPWNSKK